MTSKNKKIDFGVYRSPLIVKDSDKSDSGSDSDSEESGDEVNPESITLNSNLKKNASGKKSNENISKKSSGEKRVSRGYIGNNFLKGEKKSSEEKIGFQNVDPKEITNEETQKVEM